MKINSMTEFIEGNKSWHLSEVELELSRMAVSDSDLQAVRVTQEDLESMAPCVEEVWAMTEADWIRLRLSQDALIQVRDDLIRRLGVTAQDLPWLNRAIERRHHGHTRSQTSTDRAQVTQG